MSSSIDFDEILTTVGERGKYQTLMFLILCVPATIPVAFLTFSNLFTTASPEHWCRPSPIFQHFNLSSDEIKKLTIPMEIKENGEKSYSECFMYDVNATIAKLYAFHNYDVFDYDFTKSSKNEYFYYEHWKKVLKTTIESNFTLVLKKCEYGWEYDKTYYDRTLVTELDLVCDNSWSPQTSTALFYVGSLFGNVFFGWVADRWGRRTSMMWMIVFMILVSIMTSFSKNYESYLFLRVLGGLFFPALYQIPFILGIEMMGPKHRPLAGMIICIMFAGAMSLLALFAYLLRDWFKLSIVTSVPFLILYGYYWIIPESPRWLLSKGRIDEADDIIQKIARCNGVKIPSNYLHRLYFQTELSTASTLISNNIANKINGKIETVLSKDDKTDQLPNKYFTTKKEDAEELSDVWYIQLKSEDNENPSTSTTVPIFSCKNTIKLTNNESKIDGTSYKDRSEEQVSFLSIFRYPNIRKKFFLLTFVWIANAVVYNGLSYNATNLGVNDFLAFFVAAAIELPSNVIAWKLMDVWGRKWLLCVTLAIGGFGCLSCMFVPQERVWVTVTFAMIGKFGVAASFAVFYVFVGESFPTVLRSQAMAVASLVASVGLLMFPYILQLDQFLRVLPMVVLGILSLSGSLATVFLPDTLNVPMPQTLEEGESFGRNSKIFSLPRRRVTESV